MSEWTGSLDDGGGRVSAPLALWSAAGLAAVVLAALTVRDLLLDAFLLDAASWWPVWAAAGVLWWMGRRRRDSGWRSPAGTAAPLLVLAGLASVAALHLAGWSALPSSAADVAGQSPAPPGAAVGRAAVGRAVISAVAPGVLRLGSGTGGFYQVRLLRRGGTVGPPAVSSSTADGAVRLEVGERDDPGWFRSAGWEVAVSPGTAWGVEAAAEVVEGDLSGVRLSALSLAGDGRLRVGEPHGQVPVRVEGEMVLEVPARASVEVIGRAEVGPGWEFTADGRRFLGDGPGSYVIVAGDNARLTVRQWEPEPASDSVAETR